MLIDTFGRQIEYIRVSVTKQCNFRCQYCMPNTPDDFTDTSSLVPLDKMLEFLKIAIDKGIKKIRFTGGEPLLRPDLTDFIQQIHHYAPEVELALTTNGYFLEKYAQKLKDSGIRRLNISLDSLQAHKVQLISKRDVLPQVLKGIHTAKEVGIPIKINMVPLKGINDDEIVAMLNFCIENHFQMRYIEYMENTHANATITGLSEAEILQTISQAHSFAPLEKHSLGPAKNYQLTNGAVFGIIAPHNDDFCKSCNRVRLTSEGVICPCLYYQDAVEVRDAMLSGDKAKMQEALLLSVKNKPEKNQWDHQKNEHSARAFYYTGG
ncbi:cyclic pyranopterin phosphate synthase [Helicobacter enhydrae]|uniref:GTP 3',8-cyclase n=1 Tax=Helicobacter enhydrae TaxID=222136 RepID=A0A1B1U5V2_9HELI|nr:GTP 3',8-cyclase MoaA [Helicobacter enhydrae]ANV98130.1 cyclic pyranopterin phosphate synthase [Helicobacter enhydrae]